MRHEIVDNSAYLTPETFLKDCSKTAKSCFRSPLIPQICKFDNFLRHELYFYITHEHELHSSESIVFCVNQTALFVRVSCQCQLDFVFNFCYLLTACRDVTCDIIFWKVGLQVSIFVGID